MKSRREVGSLRIGRDCCASRLATREEMKVRGSCKDRPVYAFGMIDEEKSVGRSEDSKRKDKCVERIRKNDEENEKADDFGDLP